MHVHLENFIGGGGSSVVTMESGHNQMKNRCGFYSKLGYCEGVVEEFWGGSWRVRGKASPLPPPLDETLGHVQYMYMYMYIPYSGYLSGGKIFVVFMVER